MAASMVNIADFRCRDWQSRFGHATSSRIENRGELSAVDSGPAVEERGAEPVAENPAVLDISAARDKSRMRQRIDVSPAPAARHRSNLIRFNEPQVAVMRINQPRGMADWSEDDYDHPPAA
jgi:hypothetical protein